MNHEQIVKALNAVRPQALWTLKGDSLEGLIWLDEMQSCPTEFEVESKINELEGGA